MKARPDIERLGSSQAESIGQPQKLPFNNALPGGEEVWEDSPLGTPDQWSPAMQALSLTLSAFAYPAALYWGEEFVLLHNQKWTDAGGVDQQGQRQRGKLNADGFNALSSALHGGQPKKIPSQCLLRSDSEIEAENYTVLISPLFDDKDGSEDASGLLAQLLPKNDDQHSKRDRNPKREEDTKQRDHAKQQRNEASAAGDGALSHPGFDGRKQGPPLDSSTLGEVADNIPLDEHPFFYRFAEMLPSGLAILDHKAQAVFVNQHFYELTTHRSDDQSFKSWPQSIHSDDYDRVMEAYHDAFVSQQQVRMEFRAQGKAQPWRLLLLTPLGDENLQHVSLREYGGFICSIVDITSEKSAELSERKAAKEARERKEQQERFIDMISHEIRNPLSAVMHCSEDIADAIADKANVDFAAINEAVDTINLCISHQRNIVDDVLSFSKLDASMLSLTPRPSQPSRGLANSLKMFQPEFRKQGLEFEYRIDHSYVDFGISWVVADLARIGQVLINLVSNAIKFTARSDGEKKLTVSVGASKQRPTSFPPSVVFFEVDEEANRMDATGSTAWGAGDVLYVMVAVKDTGIGISEEGQKRLFERFRQATPKTGEIYGGSGLGLNISRKLCHLHGGDIGVSSKADNGSTFGFFFKVKKSEQPQEYDGRPEDDYIEDEKLRSQVTELGNAVPDRMDSDFMPESLKNPPVKHVDEVNLQGGEKDERLQKTQEIADDVQKTEGDQRAGAEKSEPAYRSKTEEKQRSKDESAPETTEHRDRHKQSATASTRKSNGPHVLLVEDNKINQRIVHRKLEAKGFTVTVANHGREAVDILRKAPKPSSGDREAFDIVLIDQEMPVLDGNAATREIRDLEKQGELEHLPILGVTANVRGAQQDEMAQSGMDDVITKPYKIDDLVQKINEMLKPAS